MDDFGIVYLIDNAQQFWSELEDILHLPSSPTLSRLDSTLRRFIALCATYHEQFLQNTMQIEHACDNLLHSELFTFHSERMCELLSDDAQTTTDPHTQLILYNICLMRGRQSPNFLRSHKRWQPLIPLLMDHIQVDVDPEVQGIYTGSTTVHNSGIARGIIIPVEAKIRSLSVRLLYEVCRVQKFSFEDLRVFQDSFLEYLFDLVEQTRDTQDESFNYSVIKLIVALNEQFMVASLPSNPPNKLYPDSPENKDQGDNRVLGILMGRLGSSQTFSENLIFMLNRAGRSPEDLCMQLLVLKLLYILFTTKGTSEYFYTNDLCVLVDVFLREVVDLDEDSESLRHTYLRVLHPLLTKTQLRDYPYKRPQIVRALESLVANANIRDINPTTKRLVDRCMGGDWCVQFRKTNLSMYSPDLEHAHRNNSPGPVAASSNLLSLPSQTLKQKSLKAIKSAENMRNSPVLQKDHKTAVRKGSNDSAASLPNVISAKSSAVVRRKDRAGSVDVDAPTQDIIAARSESLGALDGMASSTRFTDELSTASAPSGRHSAPLPPKRRKPPAVPIDAKRRTHSGTIISTIASSSASSPLAHPNSFR